MLTIRLLFEGEDRWRYASLTARFRSETSSAEIARSWRSLSRRAWKSHGRTPISDSRPFGKTKYPFLRKRNQWLAEGARTPMLADPMKPIKGGQFPVPTDEFPVRAKKLPVPYRTGNCVQRTGTAATAIRIRDSFFHTLAWAPIRRKRARNQQEFIDAHRASFSKHAHPYQHFMRSCR